LTMSLFLFRRRDRELRGRSLCCVAIDKPAGESVDQVHPAKRLLTTAGEFEREQLTTNDDNNNDNPTAAIAMALLSA